MPLLRPGLTPETLRFWFPDEEPVAVAVREGPTAMIEAMPAILSALGEDLPTDNEPLPTPAAPPVAELVLHLSDPRIATEDGARRATANAWLEYDANREDRSTVVSRRGCSTTLKSTTDPSNCCTLSGMISSRNLPASIAAIAR